MSARFKATFNEEPFEVEISSNGELSFPGYDEHLEYEIAYAAMGGHKTTAMYLLELWIEEPIEAICTNIHLERNTLALIAIDWAEHVLPLFEREYPEDKNPHMMVAASRKFVSGKISKSAFEVDKQMVRKSVDRAWRDSGLRKAETVAWSVARSAELTADVARNIDGSAETTAWAASMAAAKAAGASTTGFDQERAWQVRHFVHVMECLQAGKNRPKTKETP